MDKSDGYGAGHRWTFCGQPRVVSKPSSMMFGWVYVHFEGADQAVETTELLGDPNWVYVGPPEVA